MNQPPPQLNATAIIRRLMYQWIGTHRSFVLPNYTPSKWWECDVFEITNAGYFREYEVKLTRHDFKRDSGKTRHRWRKPGETGAQFDNKHALLTDGDPSGPKQFYYVMPNGLIQESEIPKFAGFIGLTPDLRFIEIKKAPVLHHTKADAKIKENALGSCYWRMHNFMQNKNAI